MTAFEQMPYPAYIESLATVIIGLLIPLFAVLSFAFVIPPILKRWVIEIDEQMGRAVDRLIYEEISLFISAPILKRPYFYQASKNFPATYINLLAKKYFEPISQEILS